MALNLDDLIGSMQHVHAGDRGQGIEEMRENLRATLGQDALGPQGTASGGPFAAMTRNVSASSMNGNGSAQRRKIRTNGGGGGDGSGGAAPPQNSYRDEAMFYEQQHQQQQSQVANANDYQYGQSLGNASSSSGGSYNTTASSGAGSSGFGWNAQVPANTPQQGVGLDQQGHYYNGNHTLSNTSSPTSQPHTPSSHSHYYNTRSSSNSPRKLVNGFHPSPGSVTTPTQQSSQANVGQW